MPEEPKRLTPEQIAACRAALDNLRCWFAAALQGFAAVLPVIAAAAERLKNAEVKPDEPRVGIDLAKLKAALADGAVEMPTVAIDREGKWRYLPSAN